MTVEDMLDQIRDLKRMAEWEISLAITKLENSGLSVKGVEVEVIDASDMKHPSKTFVRSVRVLLEDL